MVISNSLAESTDVLYGVCSVSNGSNTFTPLSLMI